MDSCDFSTHMYEADPFEADENLEKFSFSDTEKYIIPLLKAAEEAAGKKLNIMLSPWSPPTYMKTNKGRKKGGSLKTQYRKRWAEYICRYIEEFKKRGYKVNRISVQNEPKAVQEWDSCVYTPQEEKEFLRDFLIPALRKHGLEETEVFIWDHNKERVYERINEIVDSTTRDMVAGIAFHWYSGDHFEALELVRNKFPDKKMCIRDRYYNNCKNPPIHYIVFATPHKKKYLLQKRQSKDWRFYVIGNLLSYNVKFSGGAHCGGTELCR